MYSHKLIKVEKNKHSKHSKNSKNALKTNLHSLRNKTKTKTKTKTKNKTKHAKIPKSKKHNVLYGGELPIRQLPEYIDRYIDYVTSLVKYAYNDIQPVVNPETADQVNTAFENFLNTLSDDADRREYVRNIFEEPNPNTPEIPELDSIACQGVINLLYANINTHHLVINLLERGELHDVQIEEEYNVDTFTDRVFRYFEEHHASFSFEAQPNNQMIDSAKAKLKLLINNVILA